MTNFERVFNNNEELHPMVNKEFITIPVAIDMDGLNKKLFNIESLNDFINKIKNDKKFKDYAIDKITNHFNQQARKLISSKNGVTWFFVDYKKREGAYTLKYAESLANLNTELFFDNYIDIFGNKIEFEVYKDDKTNNCSK